MTTPPPERPFVGGVRALAVAIAFLVAAGGGCDRSADSGEESGPSASEDTSTAATADGSGFEKRRSAFGLPFPPQLMGVRRLPNGVEVTTRMDLEALERFYKTRLVDYEILRPSETRIRVIGLRRFMPMVRGHRYGPVSVLFYASSRQKPSTDVGVRARRDTGVGRPAVGASNQRRGQRRAGTPVRLETGEGKPLAPGARWGEPYTPPEGSPLDKPRYRENFGKPFGEWRLP